MRYAIVDAADQVLNVIELEPGTPYELPEGCTLVEGREFPPTPDTSPAVSIVTVSPFQVRRALRQVGLRDLVEGYVNSLGEEGQDAWRYATVIHRDNAILLAGAAALGLSDTQLDDLFTLAASL